jgi:hypothetical protein
MTDIFLTHAAQVRGNYYPERALKQLQALGNVRLNDAAELLSLDQLVARAECCQVIVASREAAASAELFERLLQLAAICRVAVDIRNIDVEAANRHGVLVTRHAGFRHLGQRMSYRCDDRPSSRYQPCCRRLLAGQDTTHRIRPSTAINRCVANDDPAGNCHRLPRVPL